jgi:SPP1 family predicted phage head-tail adaptor
MLDKISVPDGYGGKTTQWIDGAEVDIAISSPMPTEVIAAQQHGNRVDFDITTKKNLVLEYHDVFKRIADGKIFRITEADEDNVTPDRATFQIRKAKAEEWVLTGEYIPKENEP